ncbi:antimicrobial peptide microplusin-like [Ixodes scapularis]|uniref:antimicrobial peptide microplusin-like n=1 Tax=Ixodes scapularis TaxID=6945 RepID=UPI001A9EB786|nr:antimicrobial peptide microplusin-like [Ixodes scapularis]
MKVIFFCYTLAAFLILASSQKFDLCDKTDDQISWVCACIRSHATEGLQRGLKSLWDLTKCTTDVCMARTFCKYPEFPAELYPFLTHEQYVELEKLLGECLDSLPRSHRSIDMSGTLQWIMSYLY